MANIKKTGNSKTIEPKQQPLRKRSFKGHVKSRYDTHMPDKKHHRVLVWIIFLACATMIAIQLLYPPDRALPLTRVSGENVGWREHDQLAELIAKHFRNTSLKLVTDSKSNSEVLLTDVGAEPNTEAMIQGLISYPFWQRFIPFSIFAHTYALTHADIYFTSSLLEAASEKHATDLSFEPVNARLAIENKVLIATSEKKGSEVDAPSVYRAIAGTKVVLGGMTDVTVSSKPVDPKQTARSLKAVQSAAEVALGRQVIIKATNHIFIPDDVTIASWLQIGTDEAGQSALRLTDDTVNKYLDVIDAETGLPAGQTNIDLTNGRETNRIPGSIGRVIDRDVLKAQIADWLLRGEGQSEFAVVFQEVAPRIIYDNKYTATEDGLRTYVADAAQKMNVRIAIQQLDGGKWSAAARADDSTPSASTYKLFVSKWLFDQMDKGTIHWDDSMLDTTVSTCFDRMTIASTNPCAESWLAQLGRSNMNQYVYGLGFSHGTTFTSPIATHSTASDLQRIMIGVNDCSMICGAHRDRLLRSLATHPYRYGIPAGSEGQVWDKVGFLWDYVHDTAIVKHPKGTYVMTIMTKGQSYATIASLTREIERIMYP